MKRQKNKKRDIIVSLIAGCTLIPLMVLPPLMFHVPILPSVIAGWTATMAATFSGRFVAWLKGNEFWSETIAWQLLPSTILFLLPFLSVAVKA